jgi:hypothetical protein
MSRSPRRRPSLEALEDRRLPATFGLPWPDPGHLTLSFTPDGTAIGSAPSALTATLGAVMPAPTWQRTILRAVQSWADLSNINVGLVADDGEAAGQPGPLEGNPNVGDIRVSARPLSHDTLALTTPFDLLDDWSGDVVLNSTDRFSQGGANDLFTAALHEAGHVFGLDDDPSDRASAMYTVDNTPKTGPDAADVAALRALYGTRQPDAYEGARGNDTPATATPLTFVNLAAIAGSDPPAVGDNGDPSGPHGPWVARADVSTLADKDVYAVTANGGPLAAVVHASGISLLTPRVTVLDASGKPLASAAAADPLGNDVIVTLPATTPGATYYVKVESANPDVFGIGGYRVAVGSPVVARLLALVPAPATGFAATGHKGPRFDQAADLSPQTPGTDARWPYAVRDGLASANETDFYRVTTPRAAAGPPGAMLVTVWGLTPGGLSPAVTVLDARHMPVPVQVLNRDAASVTVQVPAVSPGTAYVVEVSAADPAGSRAVGGYFLGIDLPAAPVSPLAPFASGTLDASRPTGFQTLTVDSSEVFRFDLSGDASGAPAGTATAVRMTLFDASGNVVFNVRAYGGAGSSAGDALLAPGTYYARFTAATKTGAPLPSFSYRLRGSARSHPIGPTPVDVTHTPTGTTVDVNPYDWTIDTDPIYAGFLKLTDVLSNPWM